MNHKNQINRKITHILFGIIVFVLMLITFLGKLTPIYEDEYLLTTNFTPAVSLHPGDEITQSFQATYSQISTIAIAFAYDESLPDTANATVQVRYGDTIVMSQPLQVNSIPNYTFLDFQTKLKDCKGQEIEIIISNTSNDTTSSFTLMATNDEQYYLSNTSPYHHNGELQNGRLLCHIVYCKGYEWYKSLTYAFWILLAALFLYSKRIAIINRLNSKPFHPQ